MEEKFKSWQTENENKTRQLCKQLLDQLKKRHLDPVIKQLHGKTGAAVSFNTINAAFTKIEHDLQETVTGNKDVIASLFSEFQQVRKTFELKNLSCALYSE